MKISPKLNLNLILNLILTFIEIIRLTFLKILYDSARKRERGGGVIKNLKNEHLRSDLGFSRKVLNFAQAFLPYRRSRR